ncbi:MAG: hypothetical protein R6W48_10575 [Gaiellaceae bacterium]
MSISVPPIGRLPAAAHPGRRYALWSLLMVPALLVLYVPLYFLGTALQSALGLSEGELLVEAGVLGVLAWALMLALVAVPQVVGVVLGLRARRLDERRLGTIGIGLNALVGLYLVVGSIAQAIAS